ncbi:hypothetical protein KGM_209141 [Danaus plexippus plexippus]|uniref:Uncharacterized protein n=1 Tax=Danaus plexippus plexippus TaxID=278856 RepID=A0A212F854_DANPL|nr:hypothetical protein KGM_209141 [Danaus plexippus plexippus]
MTKHKQAIDLDNILKELKYGRHQKQNYCLILIVVIFSAVYNSQYIFAAKDVNASRNGLNCIDCLEVSENFSSLDV